MLGVLAYVVDTREAVVPPATLAVGLHVRVERRGGVERDSIEAPRVGTSQPAVVRDDGFISPDVCEADASLGRRVGAAPEVAPLDERRDERRPLRDAPSASRGGRRVRRGPAAIACGATATTRRGTSAIVHDVFVISRRRRGGRPKVLGRAVSLRCAPGP